MDQNFIEFEIWNALVIFKGSNRNSWKYFMFRLYAFQIQIETPMKNKMIQRGRRNQKKMVIYLAWTPSLI